MDEKKQYFPIVDLMKFFFALCIVFIHTGLFVESLGGYYIESILLRLAVPYFFVCSGFFLGRKLEKDDWKLNKSFVKRYILRIGKKLVFFEVISIIVNIALIRHGGGTIIDSAIQTIQSILFYPWGSLWYLQAVIIGIILLLPFIKRNQVIYALPIGIMLYSFALLCNRYYFIIAHKPIHMVIDQYLKFFVSARNGVFVGFTYLAIGILLAEFLEEIYRYKKIVYVIWGISMMCLIVEVSILAQCNGIDDNSLFISHIIVIPTLFLTTAVCDFKLKGTMLLRKLSTSIYLLQKTVIQIIPPFLSLLCGIKIDRYMLTILTLICVMLICTVVYSENKLNRLYLLMT